MALLLFIREVFNLKIARLDKNIVVEILPEAVHELGVAYWYGQEFANLCVQAPDSVLNGMFYDKESESFYFKEIEEPQLSEIELLKQQVEQQKLIDAMLGVSE